jgi:hypothetical protein
LNARKGNGPKGKRRRGVLLGVLLEEVGLLLGEREEHRGQVRVGLVHLGSSVSIDVFRYHHCIF